MSFVKVTSPGEAGGVPDWARRTTDAARPKAPTTDAFIGHTPALNAPDEYNAERRTKNAYPRIVDSEASRTTAATSWIQSCARSRMNNSPMTTNAAEKLRKYQ